MINKNLVVDDEKRALISKTRAIFSEHQRTWKDKYPNIEKYQSVLLTNQAKHLMEINSTADIGSYNGFVLDMARRTYAKIVAQNLISVQPMLAPTSNVFYYDPKVYTSTTNTNLDSMYGLHYNNEGYDISRGIYTYKYSDRFSGYDASPIARGIYGELDNQIYYSGGNGSLASLENFIHVYAETDYIISAETWSFTETQLIDGDVSTEGAAFGAEDAVISLVLSAASLGSPRSVHAFTICSVNMTTAPKAFTLSGSTDGLSWTELVSVSSPVWTDKIGFITTSGHSTHFSTPVAYDYYSIDCVVGPANLGVAEMMLSSFDEDKSVSYTINPQTWTEDLLADNIIEGKFFYSGTEYTALTTNNLPVVTSRWKDYSGVEAVTGMQEVQLNIASQSVTAHITRKMLAKWTEELEQDLEAYFNMGMHEHVADLLSTEIALEIDREIIGDLIRIAPYRSEWLYDVDQYSATSEVGFIITGDQREITGLDLIELKSKQRKHRLLNKINEVNGVLKKNNLYHQANWIICSTEVGAYIESMDEFECGTEVDSYQISYAGKLKGHYTVYVDPYLPRNVLLMGYKGLDTFDAGYIYAPYIMADLKDAIDPDTLFLKGKNIMTRYAKHVVTNKKYGMIDCVFPDDYKPVTNYS